MESQKVDMYISAMASKFPSSKIMLVKERLERLDDSKMVMLQSLEYKDPTTLLLISILLGPLGIDRFMLKDIGMGILKLLTMGLCGILTIIDWFTISERTKEYNFNLFMSIA